jgi:hypothetical protein
VYAVVCPNVPGQVTPPVTATITQVTVTVLGLNRRKTEVITLKSK